MNRPSFNGKFVTTELAKVAAIIPKNTTIFIIGGLALINYGLKDATKDIDIVVRSKQELETLVSSLERLGYHPLEYNVISKPYRKMETARILENVEGFRWDIFHQQVCRALIFTDTMASRAKTFYEERRLRAKMVSKEDIFLFKGITEREADKDDMRLLAESGLDWKVIEKECRDQSVLSGRLWECALLDNLVDLRKKYKIRSPIEKNLRKIAEEKLSEQILTSAIAKGCVTTKMISNATKISDRLVREYVKKMEKKGLIKIDKASFPYKFALTKRLADLT
jgi:predicted transcriptional regulator